MLTMNTRQTKIFEVIRTNEIVKVNKLFELFDVSEATIRKDLVLLENKNLILRKRGEAHILDKTRGNPFEQRQYLNKSAKQNIAKIAAEFIQDGDTIILDAGTTTLEIAKLLSFRSNLTVLTNSLPVANVLAQTEISLSLSGGYLFNQNMSTQGPEAESFFKKIEVGKAFIGASGVRRAVGLETLNTFEAEIKRLMIQAAKQVYCVVDSSKFETAGVNVFCNFSEIDFLITEKPITNKIILDSLDKNGVQIIIPNLSD